MPSTSVGFLFFYNAHTDLRTRQKLQNKKQNKKLATVPADEKSTKGTLLNCCNCKIGYSTQISLIKINVVQCGI